MTTKERLRIILKPILLFGVWIWFVLFLLLPYGSSLLREFTGLGSGDYYDGNLFLFCALILIIFILLVLFTLCSIVLYRSHMLTIKDLGFGVAYMIITHIILNSIFAWYFGPISQYRDQNHFLFANAYVLLLLFDAAMPLTYLTLRLLKKQRK